MFLSKHHIHRFFVASVAWGDTVPPRWLMYDTAVVLSISINGGRTPPTQFLPGWLLSTICYFLYLQGYSTILEG